jgi:hypothetical protein
MQLTLRPPALHLQDNIVITPTDPGAAPSSEPHGLDVRVIDWAGARRGDTLGGFIASGLGGGTAGYASPLQFAQPKAQLFPKVIRSQGDMHATANTVVALLLGRPPQPPHPESVEDACIRFKTGTCPAEIVRAHLASAPARAVWLQQQGRVPSGQDALGLAEKHMRERAVAACDFVSLCLDMPGNLAPIHLLQHGWLKESGWLHSQEAARLFPTHCQKCGKPMTSRCALLQC